MKKLLLNASKRVYRIIPLPKKQKVKLKNTFYRAAKFFMKDTQMYKVWEASFRNNSTNKKSERNIAKSGYEINNEFQYYALLQEHGAKSKYYKDISYDQYDFSQSDIKLIAFYLPQFHPIKENDAWWGKGFTEWTNVSKAMPQFKGHYQPHLPGELNFYDLRIPEIMERQVELAKLYGLYGFCFYYYWFNGRRVLEKPVDQFIEGNIEFPFCLCWANENWTRSWDGEESEVLLEQNYDEESMGKFIIDIEKYITDHRYIKIDNKPLLIIYRPALIPNLKSIISTWREYCQAKGIGDIYILGVYVKSWGFSNHKKFGLDGMLEFPPHSMYESGATLMNDRVNKLNPEFTGAVFDYQDFVVNRKYFTDNAELLYKGVCPSWDNTARRGGAATVYHGSTPELYKKWLVDLIRYTKRTFSKESQIVFINAWNEWAEGAHLEPDRRYGYAYLEATKQALIEAESEKQKKIIYVTHDTSFNGAQLLSLNIVRVLKDHFNYEVEIISKNDGELKEDFGKYGNIYMVNDDKMGLEKHIRSLVKDGYEIAICNTVISGDIVPTLQTNGAKVISLIHELPGVIKQYSAIEHAHQVASYANKIVFPSTYVEEKFATIVGGVDQNKKVIQPQGLYKSNPHKGMGKEARKKIRYQLGIPQNSKIVLCVGFADKRKGVDLFAKVASMVRRIEKNTYFVWVGNREPEIMSTIGNKEMKEVIFVDATPDVGVYYAGADIYLLTSREDPFPSVVMEAMDVGIPVIAFENAGGFADIVTDQTGSLVENLNLDEMAKEVVNYLQNEELRKNKGGKGKLLIEQNFDFINYVYNLLELLGHEYKKVSVVVPNYNYARYLKDRIASIVEQTYPVYELVFLDDHSKDQSLKVFKDIEGILQEKGIKVVQAINEVNSGSVFKQWLNGISLSSADYLWIAEADDLCSNRFLETTMQSFYQDNEVVLSYSQSKQIDEDSRIIADDYLNYTKEIDSEKWEHDYVTDGRQEISEALVVKNTIPNVSGAVFKKLDVAKISEEIVSYKIAGDLFFYVSLLEHGKIAYHRATLNYHRRHTNSVTKSEKNILHYNEVVKMQNFILERYNVSLETRKKVNNYRLFLKDYLNINTPVAPVRLFSRIDTDYAQQPEKKRYLQCGAESRIHQTLNPYENHVATGFNTGNLYIGYAVQRFFGTTSKFNMWKELSEAEIAEIRETTDIIVMGASNFINGRSDFGVTADNIERLKLPIIVLGIGAQAPDSSVKNIKLTKGTERFLYQLSAHSVSIGVRGAYTAELLSNLGINNTTVIGCPTYYLNKDLNYKLDSNKQRILRPAFNYTDIAQKYDANIFKYAYTHNIDSIGQTEYIEDCWKKGVQIESDNMQVAPVEKQKMQYYKNILGTKEKDMVEYFRNHFYQFYDIDEWAKEIQNYNFSFGTRFHGNMIAVQNGVPALLVAHDSRTKELADYCNIPYIDSKNIMNEEFDILSLYEKLDYSKFNREYTGKFNRYIDFLKLNNVTDIELLLNRNVPSSK